MEITQFFSRKWQQETTQSEVDIDHGTTTSSAEDLSQVTGQGSSTSCSQTQGSRDATSQDLLTIPPHSKKQHPSASEKRKLYKAKLSYKREWEKKYPWVSCKDASKGMFCTICQKWGHPTAGSRGAWTNKGIPADAMLLNS